MRAILAHCIYVFVGQIRSKWLHINASRYESMQHKFLGGNPKIASPPTAFCIKLQTHLAEISLFNVHRELSNTEFGAQCEIRLVEIRKWNFHQPNVKKNMYIQRVPKAFPNYGLRSAIGLAAAPADRSPTDRLPTGPLWRELFPKSSCGEMV